MSAIAKRLARLRVTLIWASGLFIILALAILWLCSLGAAFFLIYRERGLNKLGAVIVAPALLLLGAAFLKFFNRFYEWHANQRLDSLLKEIDESARDAQTQARINQLELDFSSEFSETFKRQLRDSPTFKATVFEAKKLAEEMVAFSAVSHTDEERDVFRRVWQAKTETFAERIAQDDPLAVEVILKAIEKESERNSAPRLPE